jgi:glucokinase
VVASEGGHIGFSPTTARQLELWRSIFATHGRVSAEEIVSGMGLLHVHAFVRGEAAHAHGEREDSISAEWISERAEKGDLACSGALDLFLECLGNVAGDHALAVMARGGVYLTGGVVARLYARLADSRFCEAFCAKGSLSAALMKIPVRAVTNERVVLLGAARVAAM